MRFKLSFFFMFVWATMALLSGIGNFIQLTESDRADLNELASAEVLEVQQPEFGFNPIQSAVAFMKFAKETIESIFNLATFNTPFWNGDLQAVRFMLLASLGTALTLSLGFETARLIRG